MKRITYAIAFCVVPTFTTAQSVDSIIDGVVDTHILPRFEVLAE